MIPPRLSSLGLIALLSFSLAAVAPAQDQPVPPPGTVSVGSLTFSGSGCSPEMAMVEAEIRANQLEVSLTTPALIAFVDPLDRRARRDNCIVILDITYPEGWQFKISSVDNSNGRAGLAPGVSGTFLSSYFFQGASSQAMFEYTITGPYNDTFAFRGELRSGGGLELFSPCGGGRSVVLNNEVRINPGATSEAEATGSTITLGENDMVQLVYSLLWRQC